MKCELTNDIICCCEEIQQLSKLTLLLQKKVAKIHDLSATQLTTLIEIFENKEISMGNLSKNIGIDISTLSRNINLLRKLDLIHSYPDKKDKRIIYISLTQKGFEKTSEVKTLLANKFKDIVYQIPEHQFQQIFTSISDLINILKTSKESL